MPAFVGMTFKPLLMPRHARAPGSGSAGPGAGSNPGIHDLTTGKNKSWMAGPSPAMTEMGEMHCCDV